MCIKILFFLIKMPAYVVISFNLLSSPVHTIYLFVSGVQNTNYGECYKVFSTTVIVLEALIKPFVFMVNSKVVFSVGLGSLQS